MNKPLIIKHREVLGGTAVFAGTRIPVSMLGDQLDCDNNLTQLLCNYPSLTRTHLMQVVRRAEKLLEDDAVELADDFDVESLVGLWENEGRPEAAK